MNVLFLTMSNIESLDSHGIYMDLMRTFAEHGHSVCIVSPAERKYNQETSIKIEGKLSLLKVKIGNVQKCNIIEKGITTVSLGFVFKNAIKKYCADNKFDLVLYSTPPITFSDVIKYVKKRDNARTYLLLKDIFPQNAIDLGMMVKSGAKSVIYKYFKAKEHKLYELSDYIGCMSQANVDYILKNEPWLEKARLHVNPNSMTVMPLVHDGESRSKIREKYGIPSDVCVFVYGGNLGRPQDIPFVIECLKANENKNDRYFVICGTGTEYSKLKQYVCENSPKNVLLINGLPKAEYEAFIKAFDVGLIFLDYHFTIPNFPSRLLSYMQNGMPVIACTDKNTDVGDVIEKGCFGWKCESNDAGKFTDVVELACKSDLNTMGNNAYAYLLDNYTTEESYKIIMEHMK